MSRVDELLLSVAALMPADQVPGLPEHLSPVERELVAALFAAGLSEVQICRALSPVHPLTPKVFERADGSTHHGHESASHPGSHHFAGTAGKAPASQLRRQRVSVASSQGHSKANKAG